MYYAIFEDKLTGSSCLIKGKVKENKFIIKKTLRQKGESKFDAYIIKKSYMIEKYLKTKIKFFYIGCLDFLTIDKETALLYYNLKYL